jgi:hypothetical protein
MSNGKFNIGDEVEVIDISEIKRTVIAIDCSTDPVSYEVAWETDKGKNKQWLTETALIKYRRRPKKIR